MYKKLDTYAQKIEGIRPPSYTIRINSKWIKVLNVRLETIKILEDNIGSRISNISCSNVFSDKSPQARETNKK